MGMPNKNVCMLFALMHFKMCGLKQASSTHFHFFVHCHNLACVEVLIPKCCYNINIMSLIAMNKNYHCESHSLGAYNKNIEEEVEQIRL